MSTFRTCKNCVREREQCDRRSSLKAALAGQGVTSVKHLCKDRKPLFAAGQRVSVTWPVIVEEECGDETWPATVIKESGVRFLIKVDDVDSDCDTPASEYLKNPSLYARTTAARLKPLDEPVREVCATCQRVDGGAFAENGCYGQTADGFFSGYRPLGCAAISKATGQAVRS